MMLDNSLEQILRLSQYFKSPSVRPTITIPSPVQLTPPKRDLTSPLTKKWNPFLYSSFKKDLKKPPKIFKKRVREITKGLTMPHIANVPIGSAKRMVASIMFFDIEDFTKKTSLLGNENMLYVLNLVIPIIIKIVRKWKGEIEKNTGDGIMVVFGTETRNNYLIARDSIEAAMTIRYIMMDLINTTLDQNHIEPFDFRIGIDMDEVLIARIGIKNNNFLTVVGGAANRASKLQSLAVSNGICIGENMRTNLHSCLHEYCKEGSDKSWQWKYGNTNIPYRFFHYTGDWPDPGEWIKDYPFRQR